MRKIIIALMVIICLFLSAVYAADGIIATTPMTETDAEAAEGITYRKIQGIEDAFLLEMYERGYRNMEVYTPAELLENSEILTERVGSGKVIIERCISRCTSDDGDGEIITLQNTDNNYISFKGVQDAEKGDIILTYLLYDTTTNWEDDVLERYDFIIVKHDGK